MAKYIKNNVQLQILSIFISLPLLILAVGNFQQRALLKESLSVVTILAFSQMIGLFYLTRANRFAVQKVNFAKVIGLHKFVGYAAIPILLLHPLFLVLPRFFEAGIAPANAFKTIVTTCSNPGIVFGLAAWGLLLILGLTSLLWKKRPLSYSTWRSIHYVLALLCIFCALFHVINLGRHSDLLMTTFILMLSAGGIYQTTKKPFLKATVGKKNENRNE